MWIPLLRWRRRGVQLGLRVIVVWRAWRRTLVLRTLSGLLFLRKLRGLKCFSKGLLFRPLLWERCRVWQVYSMGIHRAILVYREGHHTRTIVIASSFYMIELASQLVSHSHLPLPLYSCQSLECDLLDLILKLSPCRSSVPSLPSSTPLPLLLNF